MNRVILRTKVVVSGPVLKLFNLTAYSTELYTDASGVGLAEILLQQAEEVQPLHLVYCVSKRLTEPERHYHASKLELMAIVWSVYRLRSMLLSIKFTIYTDCNALVYLNTHK